MSQMHTISDKNAVLVDVTHGRITILVGGVETSQQYKGTKDQTAAALKALHDGKLIGPENIGAFDLASQTKDLKPVTDAITGAGMVAVTAADFKPIGAFTFDPAKQATYGV